jgi:hypothetical protein
MDEVAVAVASQDEGGVPLALLLDEDLTDARLVGDLRLVVPILLQEAVS